MTVNGSPWRRSRRRSRATRSSGASAARRHAVDPRAACARTTGWWWCSRSRRPRRKPARLLLVDPLPAGLEIDNPKLLDADALQGLAFAKSDVQPVHTEFRDDRFVAAYDGTPEPSAFFTVAYTVRAVSPGTYVHPGATVEDMYRPARFGRTASGSVTVGAAK